MIVMILVYGWLVLGVLYWIPVRLWYRRWGVADGELKQPMTGDSEVSKPNYFAMLGVTIDAPVESVWPWLLQMGNGRGGLYSYDSLDRIFGYLDRPSADRILPEYQHLAVGDVIPVGGAAGGFPVKAVKTGEALVLEPAAFIMTRKMLLGIKRRAEALCRESGTGPALQLPSILA